ncbi:ISL3 family transposase [Streptomyces sp. NPDC055722]
MSDEISYRKGQKYMTVVVDHDTARVVWMADGHGKDVLHRFFNVLGERRTVRLTHISADGAAWIAKVLADRAASAVRVMDPFHVVAWATDALDVERRASWNRARHQAVESAAASSRDVQPCTAVAPALRDGHRLPGSTREPGCRHRSSCHD